ncbi:MAG: hypothetical protein H8E17_16355, partial [Deltaproteobacteria bacterium]|nr:hypothetical protein [Deltaproteobacteria bacterium]
MDNRYLKELLEQIQNGQMTVDAAMHRLKKLPFEDLGYARIDTHRSVRTGVSEVIFCQGKTVEQIQGIIQAISENQDNILATRAGRDIFEGIQKVTENCVYHEMARIVVINPVAEEKVGNIAVVAAGTSDLPVADEAVVTAEVLGNRVTRIYDVGVAGIHRHLRPSVEKRCVGLTARSVCRGNCLMTDGPRPSGCLRQTGQSALGPWRKRRSSPTACRLARPRSWFPQAHLRIWPYCSRILATASPGWLLSKQYRQLR